MTSGQVAIENTDMTEAALRFRRSPALALALEMEAARLAGQNVISLSTPIFPAADGTMLAPLALG